MDGDTMTALMIGSNIKKLREERKITQQQLAESLGLSYQAVSKWECGTTIPDVMILPAVAEYFGVSINDLFKENISVYKNNAQRLMAVYESDIQNSEAFEKAENEFIRLFSHEVYDDEDLGSYAYLNDCRMKYYTIRAEKYYLEALEKGKNSKSDEYYRNQRQYIYFLSKISRAKENITRHLEILENEPNNPLNYASLVSAYKSNNDLQNAFQVAEKGLSLFPNHAILLVYAGDTCKNLSLFEKAIEYWDRAFFIDPEMIDTQYSLADYLMEQGEKSKAIAVFQQIKAWNEKRGYIIENKWVKDKLMTLL